MPQSVESFALTLPPLAELLGMEDPVTGIEARLAKTLPDCVRVLRWAIVRATPDQCACEGAYLRR